MPKRLSKTLDTGTNLRKLQFIGDLMLDKHCTKVNVTKSAVGNCGLRHIY